MILELDSLILMLSVYEEKDKKNIEYGKIFFLYICATLLSCSHGLEEHYPQNYASVLSQPSIPRRPASSTFDFLSSPTNQKRRNIIRKQQSEKADHNHNKTHFFFTLLQILLPLSARIHWYLLESGFSVIKSISVKKNLVRGTVEGKDEEAEGS